MSLRARLLLGLVVVAALGLVAFGVVTYAEQRSFLYDRVDKQALAAYGPVSGLLDQDLGRARAPGGQPGGPGGGGGAPPGGRQGVGPPLDVYGERVSTAGKVLAVHRDSFSELPAPKLPANLLLSTREHPHLFTVDARDSSGTQYRVLAIPTLEQPGTITVVAVPLRDASATLDRLLLVELVVAGAVLLTVAALAWWLVRLGLRPLDRMAETAAAIAGGDLTRRVEPATPKTEVGRLGLALNAMLGQIEQAFLERGASESRLRRFLSDASHELRTPLSSIRGYAELYRIGAAREPADVDKAMSRIEAESARMGVLVEDLLTLARLDEAPDPVREAVDLARLARDAADDARATAPEREIGLEADGAAVVTGDPRQLRQVVGNLVRNALVHTPAGTPIELRVSARDGERVFEVRDHGAGLPPGDPAALFDRFWRAEGGRERGAGGAGLGLAIVAAVVTAHGGKALAANAPGGGALFVVRLPAALT